MATHETDVDDTKLILNSYHHSVPIAFDVEDNRVVSHKAGIAVNTLDVSRVSRRSPPGCLHIGIPCLEWLLGIGVPFPKLLECLPRYDSHTDKIL
jgi:hypothetical protein